MFEQHDSYVRPNEGQQLVQRIPGAKIKKAVDEFVNYVHRCHADKAFRRSTPRSAPHNDAETSAVPPKAPSTRKDPSPHTSPKQVGPSRHPKEAIDWDLQKEIFSKSQEFALSTCKNAGINAQLAQIQNDMERIYRDHRTDLSTHEYIDEYKRKLVEYNNLKNDCTLVLGPAFSTNYQLPTEAEPDPLHGSRLQPGFTFSFTKHRGGPSVGVPLAAPEPRQAGFTAFSFTKPVDDPSVGASFAAPPFTVAAEAQPGSTTSFSTKRGPVQQIVKYADIDERLAKIREESEAFAARNKALRAESAATTRQKEEEADRALQAQLAGIKETGDRRNAQKEAAHQARLALTKEDGERARVLNPNQDKWSNVFGLLRGGTRRKLSRRRRTRRK